VREFLARVLHDITEVLESAQGYEGRLVRALEPLGQIVPYTQCALFSAPPGREPRVVVVPPAPPAVRAALSETLVHLHMRLVDERANPPPEAPAREWGEHLAVPLIGNDKVIGVLFVSGAPCDGSAGGYTEQHLRELAIVGAHLAAYIMIVDQARSLEEARREAESANRMKDEFLALVSHELKTPLTSTLAWAHKLRSEEMTPTGRSRAVEAIESNVHAQAKLIDEILDLACIVTAGLRLDLEAVEPARLIKAAVEEQRLRAERRSIRLETALDESVTELVVDPVRIVQVISNLLAKVIHFTPSGGHVGLRLERVGAHARIQVIDHGQGIPPEVLPHVFESFRIGGTPVGGAYPDLGIGLAIVKTLVEAHGGRVRAESLGEEKGSTFTVELPLPAKAQEPAQRLLAGIRVLLVDDDEDMRSAVGQVLENHGAEVTAVASAAAALAALERSRPHVLLSDISMPGENGYDLMRKVAMRDATLPAAAMTALGSEEDRRCALAAGFRMHLAKPLEAQTIVAAVRTLTGRPLAKGLRTAITH
jgi:signal transduction histidine kinase/ActR/RegA family two-component response regulator